VKSKIFTNSISIASVAGCWHINYVEIVATGDLVPNKYRGGAVTIGSFDGVHIGHQKLLAKCKELSNITVALTFEQHPETVLNLNKGFWPLFSPDQNIKKFSLLKVDLLYQVVMEKKLLDLTADEFFLNYIINNFEPKFIVVGPDFCFGKNRDGNIKYLKDMENKYKFKLIVCEKLVYKDSVVSSSRIRSSLEEGDIKSANFMLGQKGYSVEGQVVSGLKQGRLLGYKTANVKLENKKIKTGVYQTKTLLEGQFYNSVSNFGYKPTIGWSEPFLETHILNFNQDIYGKTINVYFKSYLRPEKKFDNLEQLKQQIANDVLTVSQSETGQ